MITLTLSLFDPYVLIKNNLLSLLSSRPGRPPKRGIPFPPMSPQDAMLHLKVTNFFDQIF